MLTKNINKTYRFRIYPTKDQEVFLSKHFGHSRWVYNYFLNERIEQYKKNRKSDDYHKQSSILTKLKKEDNTKWLKEVSSQALQFSLKSLDKAYINFYKGVSGFPKFKSRKSRNSFTIVKHGKIVNGKLRIPKLKNDIKLKLHREVKGVIGKINITKSPTGKYFVSIFTEQEIQQLPTNNKAIGCDLGIKDFLITSDSKKFKNNTYTKKYAKQLKNSQQHLSRKQKGSNGFEKQRLKVAKIYEKISSCRLDNLHKVSIELVRDNQTICIEDLNVKEMIKNRKLSKHITDASWGKFVNILQYKCDWYGRELVKVNRFFPSSKTCNKCGWINQELKLSDREWTCKNCNNIHDRDVNASINILKEGLKNISAGDVEYTGGDFIKTFLGKHKSKKPETYLYQQK